MTKAELSQLYYLNKEICLLDNQLKLLKEQATKVTPSLSGMPSSGQGNDKISKYVSEIVDISELLMIKKRACEIQYKRLVEYIHSVDDSLIRQILMYRYVNGFSWIQVANHIGNNTEDSVRKSHDRFLAKK